MTNHQVLIVRPAECDRYLIADHRCATLEFSYVAEYPADDLSAWTTVSSSDVHCVDVAVQCRPYGGGFRQHALNRHFSQSLLQCRPNLVVIIGFEGCTVDLPRVASLLGIPSLLILDSPVESIDSLDEPTRQWLASSLACCDQIVSVGQGFNEMWPSAWLESGVEVEATDLSALLDALLERPPPDFHYDYSTYEFCQRDHPLLVHVQSKDIIHFQKSPRVLDLGCGVGIFLDCLRQQGINGIGVERDPRIAEYARGMGLEVSTGDALDYLENTDLNYDGIYCSHFVEHFPVEVVQRLLQLAADRLTGGGVLVLVFPDPESIRAQLLAFWRDPQHVRFYHPELVISMATAVGLELEWSSYDDQPHRVIPFPEEPETVSIGGPFSSLALDSAPEKLGWLEKLMQKLGLVTERRFRRLEEALLQWSNMLQRESGQYVAASEQLEKRTHALWDVNQTWAWNDSVTIKLRKRTG